MNIDASLREHWTQTSDGWHAELPTGWMQGRSAFGGLTAAYMAALGRRVVPDTTRRLRTASIALLAPVTAGPVAGEPLVLREGRNITFVRTDLRQADALVASASFVFAKPIESSLDVEAPAAPRVAEPETLTPLPYIEGVVPEFTQNVDMRFASGGPPFTGATEAAFTGAFRYRVPIGDAEGVLTLLDTWPPPSLSLARRPTPASTVSWTAHLLAEPEAYDAWFTMEYRTVVGTQGLHTICGRLYDRGGVLVAWTEQLVAVFG